MSRNDAHCLCFANPTPNWKSNGAETLESSRGGLFCWKSRKDIRNEFKAAICCTVHCRVGGIANGMHGRQWRTSGHRVSPSWLCNTYTTLGGVRTAKSDEAFVVYKLGVMDITKRNTDCNFLPGWLYVDWVSVKQLAEWKTNEPKSFWKPVGMTDLLG